MKINVEINIVASTQNGGEYNERERYKELY
jgi:hypothetical protein